ncbi:proton pump-interactor 1-like [Gossypium australe]|uniref:Proton pump-interactor 1-like n=1 Tax=Gossypium australe TaxID=47621 RepID=A0A5B6UA69_9ROSI|nr:proton pump-interactor 1-like [Gossypium australe]
MGVEVVDSDLAQLSIDKVTEVDKSFLHENGKLDKDPVYNNPIEVDSHSEEPDNEEENGGFDPDFPKDVVDEWPAPKQIHSFHFIRYRFYEDPAIKAKLDQADKEIQKWNKARFKLTDELKAKRAERSEMLSQVRALNVDFEQFKTILDEKKRAIEPLQQALGKLRNNKDVDNRLSLCASEEELDFIIHSLQYRIQHESISLSEEKRILKEIKHLEGTREKVIANAAMRSKIQDSLGQKEDIQDQVKLMGVDLNGVRKEQHAVWSKKKQIKDKLDETETKIESSQNELKAVTLKRDKAFENIQELRKQSDQGNSHFYESRTIVHNAKLLAAQKDIKALEEFSTAEVEKFMVLWNGNKAFRDDYEKRILPSLDSRLLSRDGRIRNPDEKPLVAPEKSVDSETETILRPGVRQPKEEAKSGPQPDAKLAKKAPKDAETIAMELNSLSDISVVAEEILVSGKLQKNKEVDAAKLKELKREEEIAKAKQAMERKKKLAEKAAAKAARRAQMEAEKKLKEIICFLIWFRFITKKKAAGSTNAVNSKELIEAVAQDSEPEKVDVNTNAPAPATLSVKGKVPKENTSRYRNRTKRTESLPRAILKRRKSMNYWIWAALAVVVVLAGFGPGLDKVDMKMIESGNEGKH